MGQTDRRSLEKRTKDEDSEIEEEPPQWNEGESAQTRTQIGENDLSSARSGSHCVYDLQNSGDKNGKIGQKRAYLGYLVNPPTPTNRSGRSRRGHANLRDVCFAGPLNHPARARCQTSVGGNE